MSVSVGLQFWTSLSLPTRLSVLSAHTLSLYKQTMLGAYNCFLWMCIQYLYSQKTVSKLGQLVFVINLTLDRYIQTTNYLTLLYILNQVSLCFHVGNVVRTSCVVLCLVPVWHLGVNYFTNSVRRKQRDERVRHQLATPWGKGKHRKLMSVLSLPAGISFISC